MFEELSNVTDPTGRDLRLGKPHPCNLIHFDATRRPPFAPFGQQEAADLAPSSLMNSKPRRTDSAGQGQVSLDGLPSRRWVAVIQQRDGTNTNLKLSKRPDRQFLGSLDEGISPLP
jgi:hypothetical protein